MVIDIATMQYKRLHLFHKWLICMQEQTMVDSIRINIWNNTGEEIIVPQGFSFPIRIFGLPGWKNLGSQARFYLAMELESPEIIFLDDDTTASPTFVEEAMGWAKKYPGEVLGKYGKRLPPDKNFYDVACVGGKSSGRVDWLGTTGMIAPLEICQMPELRNIPDPHWRVEDVYFAYVLAKKNIPLRYAPLPVKLRHDRFASCLTYRAWGMEAAYEELRRDWVLLCERRKK